MHERTKLPIKLIEISIPLDGIRPIDFYGIHNARLGIIKKTFPFLNISARGNELKVRGSEKDVEDFKSRIESVLIHLEKFNTISDSNLQSMLFGVPEQELVDLPEMPDDAIVHGPQGYIVRARTPNQKKMVSLASENDIVFAIGPAGTGKTYTAVALAVKALKEKTVKRIILTRPAVEAGENLGFLPGDLKEKIDPYLRPLYDALDDMIPIEKLNLYMQNRVIEIAPLAFMRGRTLDHAFIILDEAQNATDAQLKMFLTRLGPSAKCIITGDLTQIDLPRNQQSGLFTSLRILKDIDGIGTIFLNENDVVRHRLVKMIIKAYDKDKERHQQNES
ncbi:MAG TPA: PhoH family protein [Chitinophagales bacterium]|nr:PhoH family protein [Chitinophagales bacterium]